MRLSSTLLTALNLKSNRLFCGAAPYFPELSLLPSHAAPEDRICQTADRNVIGVARNGNTPDIPKPHRPLPGWKPSMKLDCSPLIVSNLGSSHLEFEVEHCTTRGAR